MKARSWRNVAFLGLAWFAVVAALLHLGSIRCLLPLWAMRVVFAVYLVVVEVFLIGAICVYCTVAHVLAMLLGLPAIKLMSSKN